MSIYKSITLKMSQYALLAGVALSASLVGATAQEKPLIGLVVKTETNPFFAKMREGAAAAAERLDVNLQNFAGKYDGDNETQVAAVESLISAGAKAIMILPNDSAAIQPTIQKAKDAGILIIALDTPLEPVELADGTFATDNFRAGELIGEWAAKTLGDNAADAKIAFIDALNFHPPVDVGRSQGFMQGFGMDIKNPAQLGDEEDPRILGHQYGRGSEEGGREAMENFLQREPNLNVVYTVNEPTAAGAYQALRAFNKADGSVIITSVDGGCEGVKDVQAGVIGATSMQFPLKMAEMGVEAAVEFVNSGKKPQNSPGLSFFDTGVMLVTDKPVEGLPSITSQEALALCWG